jgi:hypothetical protein
LKEHILLDEENPIQNELFLKYVEERITYDHFFTELISLGGYGIGIAGGFCPTTA